MSTLQFSVDINPAKIRAVVNDRVRKFVHSKNKLEAIGRNEIKLAQTRIRTTKVDPQGHPWKPWSYATLEKLRKYGPNIGGGLLYRTGAMYRSFASYASNAKVKIWNTTRYGRFHQTGTRRMPMRQFLGWSKQSIEYIKSIWK